MESDPELDLNLYTGYCSHSVLTYSSFSLFFYPYPPRPSYVIGGVEMEVIAVRIGMRIMQNPIFKCKHIISSYTYSHPNILILLPTSNILNIADLL